MNKEKANFVNLVATNLFEKAKLVEKTPIMLHRRFHLTKIFLTFFVNNFVI